MNKMINIIVVETSPLLLEGVAGMLNKSAVRCQLSYAESLEEAELLYPKLKYQMIIVNPAFFYSKPKLFNSLKVRFSHVKWIGLVFGWHHPDILTMCDGLITAAVTPKTVETNLIKLFEEENDEEQNSLQEILTGREIDVLKLLATGLANKEIADKLNISVHTVITHRKNISQKTGIKTVSGLTIYAVTQKLISIDTLRE